MICELLFPSSILAVKLNRKTLVVVLEVEIYIYDISNMKLLHVIETTKNPEGELVHVPRLKNASDTELDSYRRPVTLVRPFLSRLSIANTITKFAALHCAAV